jgi:fucose permease
MFAVLLGSIPLAAWMGKIRILRWGLWIIAAGMFLFTGIRSYISAVLIVTVFAFGQALIEALITPLVEDIHPEDDGTHLAFLHSFWPLGVIFGTLVFGESLSRGVNWRTLFLVLGVMNILVGALYPRRSRAGLKVSRADFSHAGEIFSEKLFWVMGMALFFAGAAEGGFTFWTASYIQIEYGTMARSGALGTAFFAVGMAAGRLLTSRIAARLGLKRILVFSTSMALLGGLGLYLVTNLITFYVFMGYMGFCIAPSWPGIQTHAVRRLNADPTMVMVFLSCFGIVGFSLANFIMGVIGDHLGLRTSFLVAPVALVALLLLMILESRFKKLER